MLQVELSNRLISALNLLEPDIAPRHRWRDSPNRSYVVAWPVTS